MEELGGVGAGEGLAAFDDSFEVGLEGHWFKGSRWEVNGLTRVLLLNGILAASFSDWRVLTVSAWRAFYSMKTEDVSEKRKTICIKFSFLCLYSLPLGGWRG